MNWVVNLLSRISISFFLLAVVVFSCSGLWAFSAPNVPIDHSIYRDIDKLVASGLVKDVIYGQRPWSREEIARIISVAMKNRERVYPLQSADKRDIAYWAYIDETIERLKWDYQEELIDRGAIEGKSKAVFFHPLEYVHAEYTVLDSEARAIHSNGLGSVDAVVSPLTAYEEGRRYPDGHQIAVETESWLKASSYFSMYLRPRFQLDVTHGGDVSLKPFVQQLYVKFAVPHFELEVGRDSLEWGQGEFGGVLLSNNARPLDLIKISNPSPSRLPWVFKYLGHWRYTFFVANLGPEREFTYSYLTGIKLSLKPVSFFELGFSQILALGGNGAPGPLTVGNIFTEFFGERVGDPKALNLTNRQVGLDFRLFLPFLRNAQVYLDIGLEDSDGESKAYIFADLANYHAGIYIPRLDYDGRMSLRFEYLHASPHFYRHGSFSTGMALNKKLLGDELGPDADGIYATFAYDYSPNLWFSFGTQYELRDGDQLAQVFDPDRRIVTLLDRPDESRIGFRAEALYKFKQPCDLMLEFGYDHINSFNFIEGDNRNDFLFRAGFRFYFPGKF